MVRLSQGDRGLEYGAAIGIVGSSTSPDPHTKRRLHNGNIIESGDGTAHRNFEVFMIAPGSKIVRFVHDGGTKMWSLAETLPAFALPPNYANSGFDCAHTPAATASTYFRDYELVFQTTDGDLRHCFWDQLREQWRATHPAFGPDDVDGPAGFVQLGNGAPGDFEVVVKRAGGTLENWYRDNVHNTAAWSRRSAFGTGVLHGGRSLVERFLDDTTNVSGGLDYVCVTSDQRMQRWWRDDVHSAAWQACETFGAGIDSPPAMIRSQVEMSDEKHYGRYELCVATGGKIQSWWSAGNPQPTTSASWQLSDTFGTDQSGKTVVQVLGFMSSSFGFDYEVIALLSDYSVQHFWRDANGWHAGVVFASEH